MQNPSPKKTRGRGRPPGKVPKIQVTIQLDAEIKSRLDGLGSALGVGSNHLHRWALLGMLEVTETPPGQPVKIPLEIARIRAACHAPQETFVD